MNKNDSDYSISNTQITDDTFELINKAVRMIRHKEEVSVEDIGKVLEKVGERLNAMLLHQ